MRCSECRTFVGVELQDPDANVDVEVSCSVATVTGTVRIVLVCADCGSDLRESEFGVDAELTLVHAENCDDGSGVSVEFEPEQFDEFIPPNRKRQKHMYGAEGTIKVTCDCCNAEVSKYWRDSVQSSHMEEC